MEWVAEGGALTVRAAAAGAAPAAATCVAHLTMPCCCPAPQEGVAVGRACTTCPRGVFSTKDFEPDEPVVAVPFSTILRLT